MNIKSLFSFLFVEHNTETKNTQNTEHKNTVFSSELTEDNIYNFTISSNDDRYPVLNYSTYIENEETYQYNIDLARLMVNNFITKTVPSLNIASSEMFTVLFENISVSNMYFQTSEISKVLDRDSVNFLNRIYNLYIAIETYVDKKALDVFKSKCVLNMYHVYLIGENGYITEDYRDDIIADFYTFIVTNPWFYILHLHNLNSISANV